MKFICTFLFITFLATPRSSFSQVEKFISAGTRLSALPQQEFIDFFNDTYSIVDFRGRPGLEMGGGIKFPLLKRISLEFEAGYSINPFDYLKNRQIGEGTRENTLKIESFDYGGYIALLEFASHIDYAWGSGSNWEIIAGIRFTSIYYNRQKGNFTRDEFIETVNSTGNSQFTKVDDYHTGVGVYERGLTVRGLPELGIRYWCLQKGKAGLELNGGVSLSSIFPKDFSLRAHFIGLAYIQKWHVRKRNKKKI